MIVGAIRLTFMVPPDGNSSHGAAHKIKDHLWSKFKIAVAEIPSSSPSQLVLGAALVGHDENQTRDRVNKIITHLNDWGGAEMVNDEVELIHFDDLEMERDFEKYDP